jgi:hypothetical protein
MSVKEKDVDVGYLRPPKKYRWKKGQSGNSQKVRGNNTKKIWKIVEEVLGRELAISENGKKRSGTVLEAILLQLMMRSTAGSKRAFRVFRKYEAFAKTKPDRYVPKPEGQAEAEEEYRKIIQEL